MPAFLTARPKAFSNALILRTGKNIPSTVLGSAFNNSTTFGASAIVLGLSALVSRRIAVRFMKSTSLLFNLNSSPLLHNVRYATSAKAPRKWNRRHEPQALNNFFNSLCSNVSIYHHETRQSLLVITELKYF